MKNLAPTKIALLLIPVLLPVLALVACADKPQPQWDSVATTDVSFDDLWDACLASLKQRSFQIDRRDRRFGLIVTKPIIGKQFFEFWRKDTADLDDLLNSSLHTIRRIVTITITRPKPSSMQFQVDVQVRAHRASIPGDQLDNTVEAFELLSRQGVPAAPSKRDYKWPQPKPLWVDIGREPALEQAIMTDITRRLKS